MHEPAGFVHDGNAIPQGQPFPQSPQQPMSAKLKHDQYACHQTVNFLALLVDIMEPCVLLKNGLHSH